MRFAATLASALALASGAALAEPVETEIPDVTAEVVELRTQTRRTGRVRYVNGGPRSGGCDRFEADKIVLVEVKSKRNTCRQGRERRVHRPARSTNGAST